MRETFEADGARTHVLAEGTDERGDWIRFRHETTRPGRMAGPHWHPVLAERFTVVTGTMRFRLDGQWRLVAAGETVHVAPRQVHEFGHDGPGELVFEHEVRPPGRHREMFAALHALHAGGRLTRSGLPRHPLTIGLLWELQDGYVAGAPPWLQHLLLGGLARLARRIGYAGRLGV